MGNLGSPFLSAPRETGLVQAIDVSSYQPTDLTELIRQTGAQHVVVRLYQQIEAPPPARSLAQIDSARANGCSVGAYYWPYTGTDQGVAVADVAALAQKANLDLRGSSVLWLDIEPYGGASIGLSIQGPPSRAEIRTTVQACRDQGVRPGIYTAHWVVNAFYGGSLEEFASYPLWAAQYDARPVLDVAPFGGWTEVMGKQYATRPCDRSVFHPGVIG